MKNSRRLFLRNFFLSGAVFASGYILMQGCSSGASEKKSADTPKNADPCSDYSELTEDDKKAREKLGYTRVAASADKHCGNCKLWLPAPEGKPCGKCQLFKGPVPAEASCTYWAPIA